MDYILKGYCRDRPGIRFIERGDYHVVQQDNGVVIDPAMFTRAVQSGVTTFQMSIVMRKAAAASERATSICPGCNASDTSASDESGWIIWRVYAQLFWDANSLKLCFPAVIALSVTRSLNQGVVIGPPTPK